jgi:hypothetical protein
MPLLNSELLSNWYKITLPGYGQVLAESFTQSKVQDASNKGMIQGDIGVRVMDVGTLYYTSSISGPVLVSELSEFGDLFNLIDYYVFNQRLAQSVSPVAYLLKSAQIQVTTESVRATTNFEGDFRLDAPVYNSSGAVNLLARTARFYDTTFYIGDLYYNIISADININFDIDKNFFLGQGQAPFFSLKGYNATGNVKLALNPTEYANLTAAAGSFQESGTLKYNTGNIGLVIANSYDTEAPFGKILRLGSKFVITKIEFSMQQNSIITATIDFSSFFNSSTFFRTLT